MGEKETASDFAEKRGDVAGMHRDDSETSDDSTDAQRSNDPKMQLDRAASEGGGEKGDPDPVPEASATIIKSKSNITNN